MMRGVCVCAVLYAVICTLGVASGLRDITAGLGDANTHGLASKSWEDITGPSVDPIDFDESDRVLEMESQLLYEEAQRRYVYERRNTTNNETTPTAPPTAPPSSTSPPSAPPTAAGTATISLAVGLSITADVYTQPAVKYTYEAAVGISMGVFSTVLNDYIAGNSVASQVTSRRQITVTFTVTVTSDKQAAALSSANSLTAEIMTTNLAAAKTALLANPPAGITTADLNAVSTANTVTSISAPTCTGCSDDPTVVGGVSSLTATMCTAFLPMFAALLVRN